jgi:hypothetical protein
MACHMIYAVDVYSVHLDGSPNNSLEVEMGN